MGSINIINLIKPNVYMTSIDLKDAFFSVSVHNDHQKYLKFIFGNLLEFTSMYGPAMIIFTKISKVPSFDEPRSQLSCICRRFISPRTYIPTLPC